MRRTARSTGQPLCEVSETENCSSYSLILMVMHYLQCVSDPPILPNLQKLYPDWFQLNKPLAEMRLFGNLPKPLPGKYLPV